MPCSVCIHGHFYQPPRENPWLEDVEIQESAAPWHDWNERITEECYGPNSAARIFDEEGWIRRIVNNYSRISFNFGPTLLSWMERKRPQFYRSILEADRIGAGRFSGHGPAIAQAYNHMILPLANRRDKITQVLWGIEDFNRRFGREPEGMWLAETAVDSETLDILASNNIRFTILAPRQAAAVRKNGTAAWTDASGERIDTSRPYTCVLPSGRSIVLFFYNGRLAQRIAYGDALKDGGALADMLVSALPKDACLSRIVSVATDGETFGHHHKYGDMALAYCLEKIEKSENASLTIFGEYLDSTPPSDEVRILENSSWSCVHGVGRWKEDCGCSAESRPGWKQAWRKPLREALDDLRDALNPFFEREAKSFFPDPWSTRNRYIEVIFDRSPSSAIAFLERESGRELQHEERVRALRLMELQRNLMLMFTSCGWFFDDISRIETLQILAYAARVLELGRNLFPGQDFETPFKAALEKASSNINELQNGKRIFDIFVTQMRSDLLRAGAHYAVSSLFTGEEGDVLSNLGDRFYSYRILSCSLERKDEGVRRYALGYVKIRSDITLDEKELFVAALYRGGRNVLCGVAVKPEPEGGNGVREMIGNALQRDDEKGLVAFFGHNTYSLRHLFKDEQRRILNLILAEDLDAVTSMLRRTLSDYSELLSFLAALSMPAPEAFRSVATVVLNDDMKRSFEASPFDIEFVEKRVNDALRWGARLDIPFLRHAAVQRLEHLFASLERKVDDVDILQDAVSLLSFLKKREWEIDLWDSQNLFAKIVGSETFASSCCGELYESLGKLLLIRLSRIESDFSVRTAPHPEIKRR
jgi:alpha-amylase/alpha-mannosidase (GH57 family)